MSSKVKGWRTCCLAIGTGGKVAAFRYSFAFSTGDRGEAGPVFDRFKLGDLFALNGALNIPTKAFSPSEDFDEGLCKLRICTTYCDFTGEASWFLTG